MSEKDQCRAEFFKWVANNPNQIQWANEEAWALRGWQAAWVHQFAALNAKELEAAQVKVQFQDALQLLSARKTANAELKAALATKDAEIARLREALSLANEAMNHLGDILNAHDIAEPESVAKVTPAFYAVRAALGIRT